MESLIDFLMKNYGVNEPIFTEDLKKKMDINSSTLRQYIKRLTDEQKLIRYDKGIYFIPRPSPLLKKTISLNKVIEKKYMFADDTPIGYQTGIAFANDLRLTTQTAGVFEVVTNKETNSSRKVNLKNRTLILRKPRVKVTASNYRILPLLDIIGDVKGLSEKSYEKTINIVINYAKSISITGKEFDNILSKYPKKTKIEVYESGLYDVFARK